MGEEEDSLFVKYMTQPVEQYSLLSSHDSDKNDVGRRWIVRRLTKLESKPYYSRHLNDFENNFFRLAVPFKPIIGWDLTPVIDVKVIPALLMVEQSGTTAKVTDNDNINDNDNDNNT